MEPGLEDQIREILAIELQCAASDVRGGASLRKDLGMDSVAAVGIVFAIEEMFGVHVPEAEFEHVDDMDQIVRLVHRYR